MLEGVQRWANDDLRSLNAQIEYLVLREALRRSGREEPSRDPGPEDTSTERILRPILKGVQIRASSSAPVRPLLKWAGGKRQLAPGPGRTLPADIRALRRAVRGKRRRLLRPAEHGPPDAVGDPALRRQPGSDRLLPDGARPGRRGDSGAEVAGPRAYGDRERVLLRRPRSTLQPARAEMQAAPRAAGGRRVQRIRPSSRRC